MLGPTKGKSFEMDREEIWTMDLRPIKETGDGTFGELKTTVRRAPAGVIYVEPVDRLGPYPNRITERLVHWAREVPDRTFLAERNISGRWRCITYAQTLDAVERVASALLDRDLSPERPLAILSGNGISHGLMALAALHVGVPYAPISPAYSTLSKGYENLRHIVGLLRPGLVFAAGADRFAAALEATIDRAVEVIADGGTVVGRETTPFEALLQGDSSRAVASAHARISSDTIAKLLFTSGSTGMPKGVINTHRMLCSNQEMNLHLFRFFRSEPPIMLDWSPWHHTAGGNMNFNQVLYNGGTLYIDEGKPNPQAIERTVRNLREVSPNLYFNVPAGYAALLPYLRADETLRRSMFRNLKVLQYAGAGMPQHIWDELRELAIGTYGRAPVMATGYGSTETAPSALNAIGTASPGVVGLPVPGLELKLVPSDEKLEARVRGPNVTPGYWRNPAATDAAFDEEGFYKLGDALRFVDAGDVSKGFAFDGRVAENFKLTTGTWVHVGALRAAIINHFAPIVRDVVVTGLDRDELGALLVMVPDACASVTGTSRADYRHPALRARLQALLDDFAARSTGSSNRIARLMILEDDLSLDKGELTDKGSINQRAVLRNRADLVELLYRDPPASQVLLAA